jgi:hypothetical protein
MVEPGRKTRAKKTVASAPTSAPTRAPTRSRKAKNPKSTLHPDSPHDVTAVLTVILAPKEQAWARAVEIGRERRQQQKLDLIPEGSGRAVTPDCPRIPRGSSDTVEEYDYRKPFNTYEPLALEADYVIAVFASAFVGEE